MKLARQLTLHKATPDVTTVLVVDDCRFYRTLLQRFLTREGHCVNTAADADEAVRVLGKVRHDVIILDYDLPQATGIEIVRVLGAAAGHTLVIGMCSDGSGAARAAFRAHGIGHFYAKPFDIRSLADTIRRHRQGGSLPDSASPASDRAAAFPARCYICDDHPLWGRAIAATLREAGFSIQGIATTASAMLAALRVEPTNLLVLDLDLADANALDLLPVLRAEKLAKRIVILSGRLSNEAVATALTLGADTLIEKTDPVADIVTQLQCIVRDAVVMSPSVSRAFLGHWQQPRRRSGDRELQSSVIRRLSDDRIIGMVAAELQAPHQRVREIVGRLFRGGARRPRAAT